MQEFEFIRKCTEFLPGQAEGLSFGIGDDCAVIAGGMGRDWLLSTDGYSEGIHFCSEWMSPKDIGRRCLVGAVSDIAAMGGRPRYVTISISVPPTVSDKDAAKIMEGIAAAAAAYHMVVIGGDTTAARHDLQIVLTVVGDIQHGAALYRRGARPGDVVYVTGTLGGAAAGLHALMQRTDKATSRFLFPEARVSSGHWLADTGCVTSMIDISDGLVQDLGHVARSSDVGITLNADTIPRWSCNDTLVDLQMACTSGEEYELAFTIDGRRDSAFRRLLPGVQRQLGHPITRIGFVDMGSGVVVRDSAGGDVTPPVGGFCHAIGKGS